MRSLKEIYSAETMMNLDPSTLEDGETYRVEKQGSERFMKYHERDQTVSIDGTPHSVPLSRMLQDGWAVVAKM